MVWRRLVVCLALAGALAAATDAHGQTTPDWRQFLEPEEDAIIQSVQAAIDKKKVEAVVLPVGSWQTRIANRFEEAQRILADDPSKTRNQVMAELRAQHRELFPVKGSDYDLTVALRERGKGALPTEANS